MTKIAVITLEGTLANGPDLKSALPFRWTNPLYDGIRSQFRTMALSRSDEEVTRWWLRREGLPSWSGVLCWNHVMGYEDWRIDQIREFLANGWEIGFLLDSDRDVTTVAQSMGVLTLTVGHPLVHVGWKADDHAFRPWDELSTTLDTSL